MTVRADGDKKGHAPFSQMEKEEKRGREEIRQETVQNVVGWVER